MAGWNTPLLSHCRLVDWTDRWKGTSYCTCKMLMIRYDAFHPGVSSPLAHVGKPCLGDGPRRTYPASRTANCCYDMAPLPTSWYIHTLIWSAECRMENRAGSAARAYSSIGRAMAPMLLHSSCRPHLHEKMEYPGLRARSSYLTWSLSTASGGKKRRCDDSTKLE